MTDHDGQCTRFRRRALLILISFIPVVLVCFIVSIKLTGYNYGGIVVGVLLALGYAYNAVRMGLCKCAACGRRLNRFVLFSRQVHCPKCNSPM
jgi:hypothetical protein